MEKESCDTFNIDEKLPFVSIIIPMYNEELYIKDCLLSLVNQDYPKDKYEIIVVDGNSEDNSKKIVNNLIKKYSFIKLFDNIKRITPIAFNIGIDKAKGEIICIFGAHATYEKDYITTSIYLLNNIKASCVGGFTEVVGKNYISNAISYAMSSIFGVGNAYYHFSNKEMYVESVFAGVYKKNELLKLNKYDEKYIIGQDYEINYRIRENGGKIYYSPKIRSKYVARSSLKKFAKQRYIYGLWKVKTLIDHPNSLAYRHLIPPTFVIFLVISLIMLFFNLRLGLIIPTIYIITNIFFSMKISLKKGLKYIFILPLTFAVMNISWGVGFLCGLKKYGIPKINTKIILNIFNNVK
ncbi:MAG: glycosyltransferase family 2 protein [Promethearchaeota archaeon]